MTEQENVTTQPQEQNGNRQEETPSSETAPESRETGVESTAPESTTPEGTTAAETSTPETGSSDAEPSASAETQPVTAEASTPAATEEPAIDQGETSSTTDASAPAAAASAEPSTGSAPAEAQQSSTDAPPSVTAESGTAEAGEEGATPEGEEAPPQEPGMSLEEMREIWTELEGKKDEKTPVEVTVKGVNRGGIVADYKGVEVFIPQSHWTISRSSGSSDVLVGETHEVQILEMTQFETDARRVTGTRRSLLRKELLENLTEGARLTGRVSTLTDFGAFIDLGGVDGLLHVSEISYERNKLPSEMLKKGEEVEVIIKKIDNGGKRISLSRKELLRSPWSGVAEKYPPESVQTGKVVSITDIGAFIELEPGIDGLVRPRELSWTQRVHSASDLLSVGQEISVAVLNVDEEKERMSLSLKRAEENPWPGIVEKFTGDQTWEGEVRELSNKGAVVSVEGAGVGRSVVTASISASICLRRIRELGGAPLRPLRPSQGRP